MNEALRAKLKKIGTATIATALFKRGLHNQMTQAVLPRSPLKHAMVGPA